MRCQLFRTWLRALWQCFTFQRDPSSVPLDVRGELAAARYLRRQGFRVIARRYRDRGGELDIIAVDRQTLVFVEVKTRRSDRYRPSESVDREKQRRLALAAERYMKQHDLLNQRARFDIVSVVWPDARSRPNIEHFRDAF